jgi:hypothetical protein
MNSRTCSRIESLAPIGPDGKRIPKRYRLYDRQDYADHFTIVWAGNFKGRDRLCHGIGFNEYPTSPNTGIWQHFSYTEQIDRPKYGHLGKKIRFEDLNETCKRLVMEEYCEPCSPI